MWSKLSPLLRTLGPPGGLDLAARSIRGAAVAVAAAQLLLLPLMINKSKNHE